MADTLEKIKFIDENNDETWFEVVDETVIDNIKYLLVVDKDDIATILKQINEKDNDLEYSLIEDDDEYKKVATEFMSNEAYDIEV